MSETHVRDNDKAPRSTVEMAHVSAAVPAAASTVPAASAALPSQHTSSGFLQREEVPASTVLPDGNGGNGEGSDDLRIRVWYLDDVFTRAAPKFVPDVATLKQLLPDKDLAFPMTASPTMAGDHFAEVPYSPPRGSGAVGAVEGTGKLSKQRSAQLNGAASNTRLDTMSSLSDRQSFPSISLRPSSPTHPGGHPAWVSVKAASQSELTEILDWLPIHVLTRRRILSILCKGRSEETTTGEPVSGENGEGNSSSGSSTSSDDDEGETATHDRTRRRDRHNLARDNFLEYFPAHGYAVLCLQAVPMPKGESTRRGATPKEEMVTHGTQTPCTPVVALAFESTLFTFSLSRFGGEGDVRLIVANHIASPTAHTGSRGSLPGRVATIATLSSTVASPCDDPPTQDADPSGAAFESSVTTVPAPPTTRNTAPAKNASLSAAAAASSARKDSAAKASTSADSTTLYSPGGMGQERDKRETVAAAVHPPPLHYPSSPPPAPAPPSTYAGASTSYSMGSPTTLLGSTNWNAATAISVVCSSLISAIVAYLQQSTRALLMEADQLDELVLQILPSRVDQDDMLVRTKSIRNLIAAFHIDALQKERVLKQLLLPAMRQTPLAQSTQAIERYQRSLSSVRSTVIKLRKGRDIVNMASMTLISGVSARLLTHCNFMDYLNHVQTQIAVVVMPIAVIPGIFATNVKVPWSDSQSMTPFYCILTITLALMIIGVSFPLYKFYMYRAPKALAPLE